MVTCCNRRLYKGNSYEICLPITDSGVTSVKFYTTGDVVVEKEGEIVDDTICFELAKDELDLLPDGVLRYSYDGFDSSAGYVVVTPRNYSASTLDDLLEDAFDSGYTAGHEDCSGETIHNQSKAFQIDGNNAGLFKYGSPTYSFMSGGTLIGNVTVKPDSGYTGLEDVQIFMWLPADEAVELGYQQGVAEQKGKLSSTAITQNGTFRNSDSGWSSVTVNVPQTGHTDQEMQDSWDSGYTSGYTAGQEDCSGSSCNLQERKVVNFSELTWSYKPKAPWVTPQYTISGGPLYVSADSGYDGLIEVVVGGKLFVGEAYYDGYGKGYQSGYTAGQEACTGYTQEDLDAAFASGWSAGYDSGLTDCSGETPTAATAITISVPQSLEPGDTGSTTVTVSPSGATTNFSYTSTDNSVATVDSNGVITAVGTGTTNICVTDSISQLSACTQITIAELDYSTKYLTIEAQYDGQMSIPAGNDRFYRKNGGEWQSANGNIEVSNGDKIEVKASGSASYFFSGALMDTCIVYGNIMSLFYGDDFQDKLVFPVSGSVWPESDSNCTQIFDGCMGLTDASNLVLPATAVTRSCYHGMFWGCKNLQHAPKILPATSLTEHCYAHMFSGCENLLDAPELPATELAEMCYFTMFSNCYKLTKAPVLPARVLAADCYEYMFYMYNPQENNPRLNYIECLATDLHAENSTSGWVFGVQATGTFVKNANMTAWTRGNDGIPTGWTVVDAQL